MGFEVRLVQYFYASVHDEPSRAYELLTEIAGRGISLLAFTAIPVGPSRTQLTLFHEDPGRLMTECKKAGLPLDGPHSALLVQGADEPGALAAVHTRLNRAGLTCFAASGVATGDGRFGYVIYMREKDCPGALAALRE